MISTITNAFNPSTPMAQIMLSQFIVSTMLNYIPYAFGSLKNILGEFILIICGIFHIRYYEISGELLGMIDEQIFKYTPSNINDNSVGIIVGKWYIGYVKYEHYKVGHDFYNSRILKFIATIGTYEKLTKYRNYNLETKKVTLSQKKNYKLAEKIVEKDVAYFTSRYIYCPHVPTTKQSEILRSIVDAYSTRRVKSLTSILHGVPGAGKSTIASLLTCIFDGLLISNWKLHDYSITKTSFESLYSKNKVSHTSPMILLIDEVDEILSHIIENTNSREIAIKEKKDAILTNKLVKSDWCNWLDRVDSGVYPFVLIIMTTNVPIEKFDEVDKAYLRNGRVHLRFNMSDTL